MLYRERESGGKGKLKVEVERSVLLATLHGIIWKSLIFRLKAVNKW
jgi:hypothetical protein